MKFELTKEHKKQLNDSVPNNQVHKWLKIKDELKFEIGDVLIKKMRRVDYQTKKESWVTENINSDNKMAQRYVYIFEDEFGIGYMKQLRVASGTLGVELYCMTDMDFTNIRFEVDPEYAEKVLLDGEYSIKEIHKASLAARKIAIKMNRKIGKKPKTLQEFNDFFDVLKVGDTFWTTADYTARYLQECKITKMTKVPVTDLNKSNNWSWDRFKEKIGKGAINSSFVYKIDYTGNYAHKEYFVFEFMKNILYKGQKPAEEEKR